MLLQRCYQMMIWMFISLNELYVLVAFISPICDICFASNLELQLFHVGPNRSWVASWSILSKVLKCVLAVKCCHQSCGQTALYVVVMFIWQGEHSIAIYWCHLQYMANEVAWTYCVLVHLVNVGHPNGMSIYHVKHTCGDQACKGRDHSLDATWIHQTKDNSGRDGFVFASINFVLLCQLILWIVAMYFCVNSKWSKYNLGWTWYGFDSYIAHHDYRMSQT